MLRANTYSYLTDNNDESKKGKGKRKFGNEKKTYIERLQKLFRSKSLENKIIRLNNNKISVKTLTENHKEFMKSNKIILKSRQRFKSERLFY